MCMHFTRYLCPLSGAGDVFCAGMREAAASLFYSLKKSVFIEAGSGGCQLLGGGR